MKLLYALFEGGKADGELRAIAVSPWADHSHRVPERVDVQVVSDAEIYYIPYKYDRLSSPEVVVYRPV